MTEIPTENDWRSEPWVSGTGEAYATFFGRSRDAALALFRDDAISRYKELAAMPNSCFQFYIFGYVDYLKSDDSCSDSAASAYFLCVVDDRLTDIINSDTNFLNQVIDMIEYLGERQDWFDTNNMLFSQGRERGNRLLSFLQSIVEGRRG